MNILEKKSTVTTLRLILIIILVALVGVWCAYFAYHSWYVVGSQSAIVKFSVTNESTLGFDLNHTALAFGKVPVGNKATRKVALESRVRAIAYIRVNKELNGWVYPDTNPVFVEPGVAKQVEFTLSVPEDAASGNYTGNVDVLYTRRLFWQ